MLLPRHLTKTILYLSFLLIIVLFLLVRPPTTFYIFLLIPIVLAAVRYKLRGGLLAAIAGLAGVAILITLDPDAARQAATLREGWPIF